MRYAYFCMEPVTALVESSVFVIAEILRLYVENWST
jgi:hypothetical protein